MQKLRCPRGGVSYLTFSPNGDMLAGIAGKAIPAGYGGKALYCWSRSNDWGATGLEHDGPITGLAFHPTGRTLAYAGIAGAWAAPARPPRPGAPIPSEVRRRFAKEERRHFTGVHLYSLTDRDEFAPNRVRVPHTEGRILSPLSWARGLAFTPDCRFLLAAHVEQSGLLSSRTNVCHWQFAEEGGVWRAADATAASGATERGGALVGGYLALAGSWGVAVCPVESAAGLYMPDVSAAGAVAAAPRGELVATNDRTAVAVWNLRRPEPVAVVGAGLGAAVALAFAPDGRTLAVAHAGGTGTVSLWDAPTGTAGPQRDYGVDPLTALAFAPDGLTLAVGGRGGVVIVDTE